MVGSLNELHIAAIAPSQLLEPLIKSSKIGPSFQIAFG
jgi:hypothetical protein